MKIWDILSRILKELELTAGEGVNLLQLEKKAEELIAYYKVESANKGYHPEWAARPFPSVLCTGVNTEIAHAYPRDYVLQSGDLLILDMGIKKDGVCADAGLTVPIGEINNQDRWLIKTTKEALYAGIELVKDGAKVADISSAIYYAAVKRGFVTNKQMGGHGIGSEMHQEPTIHNVPSNNVQTLVAGEIICIEPMVTRRVPLGKIDPDGWTVRQTDGRKVAMFEHMILVKEDGYEILTSHI